MRCSFRGGMELLFNKIRNHRVSLPSTTSDKKPTNMAYLIPWIRDNLSKRERPGILVLINDVDWELEDEEDYVLKDGDEIVFISTLHGG
ncbi:ubiquitin-related modifier 1 [Cantharellus anzutake]|uniref:ubiquitin-related modifier 1 n=1 Tax=Cantharellus anzutake TaxID=1750568 RepID=UPI0019084DFE|nr:ubiquitin-related modifier 1 [Cantharellus anzutake]KAF8333145.1 ubiquitin-related modifier 1 [Cantharellus anzutake]